MVNIARTRELSASALGRGEGRRRRRGRGVAVSALGALLAATTLVGCSGDEDGPDTGSAAGQGGTDASGEVPDGDDTTGTTPAPGYPRDDELRLNQIQVMGTHNSYHLPPQPEFAAGLEQLVPGVVVNWQYGQDPLPVQFADQGVRQIELDVWVDPDGRWAKRNAQAYAGLPLEPHPELAEPGLKVFHIMEIDAESTCLTFVACLQQLEDWSVANPGHVPVMVLVEAKADVIPDPLAMGFATPVPWGVAELDQIDVEIRSVFDDDQLITPDLVRGDAATLEEAVLGEGWPTLGSVRGRVMFALDNGGEVMDAYQQGHPSLEGRVMFTGGDAPGTPETAFLKLNDPVADRTQIEDAVRRGYVVRTRGDADAFLRKDDHLAQREAALAGGAQWVSTDYPVPDTELFDADYSLTMPDGTPGRCNPLAAPPWCTPADVEDPERLAADGASNGS